MKKPTHEEIEEYISKQDMYGLKEGDEVKIFRKAETYENGWNNSWESAYMDQYVDQIETITNITDYGIFVSNINVSFPYFILEKISSKKDVCQIDENMDMIESFKDWCDENILSAVGYRRISSQNFNELVEKSYAQMQSMNKTHDRMSYMCGIATGMKMILLSENED